MFPVDSLPSSSGSSVVEEEGGQNRIWRRRRLLDGSLNGFRRAYTKVWTCSRSARDLYSGAVCPRPVPGDDFRKWSSTWSEALLTSVSHLIIGSWCWSYPGSHPAVEYNVVTSLADNSKVENIVKKQTRSLLFSRGSRPVERPGRATKFCCLEKAGKCEGSGWNLQSLYDLRHSGTFGTISYLVRAVCSVLDQLRMKENIDCNVM